MDRSHKFTIGRQTWRRDDSIPCTQVEKESWKHRQYGKVIDVTMDTVIIQWEGEQTPTEHERHEFHTIKERYPDTRKPDYGVF